MPAASRCQSAGMPRTPNASRGRIAPLPLTPALSSSAGAREPVARAIGFRGPMRERPVGGILTPVLSPSEGAREDDFAVALAGYAIDFTVSSPRPGPGPDAA